MRNLQPERRQTIRKAPDQFAFLQVERDDGGSVLDVSEGGLRFETFAPVPTRGPVHLWFSLNMHERIEAWGEVVWTNPAKKRGGLRFLRISDDGREQICEWLYQKAPQPMRISEEDFPRRQRVREMPSRAQVAEEDAVARFVAKARQETEENPIPRKSSLESPPSLFMDAAEIEARGRLVPMRYFLWVKRRQLVLGLVLGVLIAGGGTIGVTKFLAYRQHNLEARGLVSAEAPTPATPSHENGTSDSLSSLKGNTAPGKSAYVPTPTRSAAGPYPDLGLTRTRTGATPTESGGHAVSRGTDPSLGNTPARTTLPLGSRATVSGLKVQKTPKQLWDAVQAGNSDAAVALAELYIKGEGVAQNCQQARVLLLVASEKNNPAAIKRLRQLDNDPTACP